MRASQILSRTVVICAGLGLYLFANWLFPYFSIDRLGPFGSVLLLLMALLCHLMRRVAEKDEAIENE